MANSVLKDRHGPDWPLGFVAVAASGTPVPIMTNVDPTFVNDPTSPSPGTSGAAEFTVRFQQLIIQGVKPGATGMVNNTGNVYLLRRNVSGLGGSANKNDPGVMLVVVQPGQTIVIASSASANDVFGPYRYSLDADTSGEGALITLLIM